MADKQSYPDDVGVRRCAEKDIRAGEAVPTKPLSRAEAKRLVHELQAQESKLEMSRPAEDSLNFGGGRAEDCYRSLFNKMTEGSAVHEIIRDEKGEPCDYRFLDVNPAFEHLTGLRRDAVIGKTVREVFPEEHVDWIKIYGAVVLTGQPVHFEDYSAAWKRHYEVYAYRPAVRQLAIIFTDVTERKQAEEELRRVQAHVEAADRAKSEFLANMSHEIRTPMTAVLGFSDILCMSPQLSSGEQHSFLEEIRKNGKALLGLIDDILDLSRIEADRLPLEKVACPLRQIVDDALAAVQLQAKQKRLSLEVDYQFPLPETIRTDPSRLRQVLVNLVGNAVKFTEQGGVRISVGCLRAVDGTGQMRFAVSDTGIGIPADKIEELFQPFMQVDASSTRRYGGSGLGLAVSQRLAKLLGGGIEVASELGRGSTFTLTIEAGSLWSVRMLPAPSAAPAAMSGTRYSWSAAEALSERQPPLHGRVLFAEDHPGIQSLVAFLLRKMNLEVDLAADGRRACEMAEKSQVEGRPYDLIFMDIQMPGMNGYEATRWLRQDGWRGPIVALTAYAMVGDREKCLAAGCDDYLSKPVVPEELRGILTRYLSERDESQREVLELVDTLPISEQHQWA